MDISQELVGELRSASGLGQVDVDESVRPLVLAALASVLKVGEGLPSGTVGVSWGEGREADTLLRAGDRYVHARVRDGQASATNYPGPVAVVEAGDITKFTDAGGLHWRVTTWHVTLTDGAVISLRADDAAHAEEVAEFVRTHLVP